MNSTELIYPADATTALDQRERELAAARFRTRTTRPEQVVLVQFRLDGRIDFDDVLKAVLTEHNYVYESFLKYEDNYGPECRDAVDADIDIIWGHLTSLVNGESVQSEESCLKVGMMDPDDLLPLGEAAATQLMRDLEWLLRVDATYDFTVAGLLPAEIHHEIEANASRCWLGDLVTAGAAMHSLPPYGHSNSVDNSRYGLIYFGDMLAESLLRYAADYREASAQQDAAAMQVAAARMEMLWMLLKGFVYAGSESEYSKLSQQGPKYPQMVDRMVEALTQGLELLKEFRPDGTNPHKDIVLSGEPRYMRGDQPVPRISELPTAELVARLRATVEKNNYDVNNML